VEEKALNVNSLVIVVDRQLRHLGLTSIAAKTDGVTNLEMKAPLDYVASSSEHV